MAWEAGGAATDIHVQLGVNIQDLMDFEEVILAFKQPNLLVNSSGERIMNEEIIETTAFGANPVARQKDQCAYMIFDEDTKNGYQEYGVDFPSMYPSLNAALQLYNFDAEFQQAVDRGSRSIFSASTLEELADMTGLPAEELKNTVAEYNQASNNGRDPVFNKDARFLRSINQPKYYAAKLTLGGMETFGGIRINYKTEVLDKEERVIPGLYAAGNDANSIYGDTYPFFLPGNTLGFALNTGRIAGENAASYLK
jgi:fumarate reductase flavoprotein subunit